MRRWFELIVHRVRGWPKEQLLLTLGVLAFCVAIGVGLVFVKLAESVWRGEEVVTADARLHEWFVTHRAPWLTDVMRFVTNLGSALAIVSVTLIVVLIALVRRRPQVAVFMAAATAGAAVLVQVVKAIVDRPRPATTDHAIAVTGQAFPSGHAAQSLACYGAVAVIVIWTIRSRLVAIVAATGTVVAALLIGGSRVYLGVHWPSDVIAGWALAAAWLAALIAVRAVSSAIRNGRRAPPHQAKQMG